jgi:hypothetical protein
MNESTFKTVNLPTAVAGQTPQTVAQARSLPTRVLVENISGTLVFLAKASQDIVGPGGAAGDAYRLRPNVTQVFVLAPNQQLFGAGNGVGARVSVTSSDALPLV